MNISRRTCVAYTSFTCFCASASALKMKKIVMENKSQFCRWVVIFTCNRRTELPLSNVQELHQLCVVPLSVLAGSLIRQRLVVVLERICAEGCRAHTPVFFEVCARGDQLPLQTEQKLSVFGGDSGFFPVRGVAFKKSGASGGPVCGERRTGRRRGGDAAGDAAASEEGRGAEARLRRGSEVACRSRCFPIGAFCRGSTVCGRGLSGGAQQLLGRFLRLLCAFCVQVGLCKGKIN